MKSMICWSITIRYILGLPQLFGAKTYPDVGLTVTEMIIKQGYPVEVYGNVITKDNYLLDVYRIPHGKTNKGRNSRPVVLLMHGLMGSSRDFVVMGPERGMGYLLAERGYDVWLGNNRGTTYARKHKTLNPDIHEKYWDFSWHEMGIYDLPAIFELIRSVTKAQNISYVGNSQGTTQFYVLTSEKPEYNNNITIMAALPPVAFMGNLYSPIIRLLARYESFLSRLAKLLGVNEIPPKPINELLAITSRLFCKGDSIFIDICAQVFFTTGGYDYPQLNKSALYTLYGDGSAGSSVRQLFHYAQNINSGYFRQYNYGQVKNMKRYGSPNPPHYDLSKIVAPIALYYAQGDWIIRPQDVEHLYRELPNCVYKYKIPYQQFNHFDFMFATDVVSLIYDNLFQLLDKYNNIK